MFRNGARGSSITDGVRMESDMSVDIAVGDRDLKTPGRRRSMLGVISMVEPDIHEGGDGPRASTGEGSTAILSGTKGGGSCS